MASVFDVAQYILGKCGPVEAMKLQKLVYYSQAWRVVQCGAPLFSEPVKAYEQGPVVGMLFHRHKGLRFVSQQAIEIGSPDRLTDDETALVDSILVHYGHYSGDELSERTHLERPWTEAFSRPGKDKRIYPDALRTFYSEQSVYAEDAPAIPTGSYTYVEGSALDAVLAEVDVPDDISGLLSCYDAAAQLRA